MLAKKHRYGLIGKPLSHSLSKAFFTEKFATEGIDAEYENYELDEISEVRVLMQEKRLEAFSVTHPFKEAIIGYVDELSELARELGSVNLVCHNGGRWIGYNTDYTGFAEAIKPYLRAEDKKALVLGTGGFARTATYALRQMGIEAEMVSRDKGGYLHYEDLSEEMIKEHTVIVNATPVGMEKIEEKILPIDYRYITDKHLLFDAIYKPSVTHFLHEGEKRGARTVNGYEMLIKQAEEGLRIMSGMGDLTI